MSNQASGTTYCLASYCSGGGTTRIKCSSCDNNGNISVACSGSVSWTMKTNAPSLSEIRVGHQVWYVGNCSTCSKSITGAKTTVTENLNSPTKPKFTHNKITKKCTRSRLCKWIYYYILQLFSTWI